MFLRFRLSFPEPYANLKAQPEKSESVCNSYCSKNPFLNILAYCASVKIIPYPLHQSTLKINLKWIL